MTDLEKLHDLSSLSLDRLAEILADEAEAAQFGSTEPAPHEKRRFGYALLSDIIDTLRPHICERGKLVQKIAKSGEADLVAQLVDLVSTTCGGVPVLVVTSMLLKYGLKKICSETE